MKDILVPGIDHTKFLKLAMHDGWGMQNPFMQPEVVAQASMELEVAELLEDLVELEPTS